MALTALGLSRRGVAQALNISYGSAVNYLNRVRQAVLTWPLPDAMDERTLGRLLFPTQPLTGQQIAGIVVGQWIPTHNLLSSQMSIDDLIA